MKYALLGIILILYCLWLTPAFLLPEDIVVSTGYILIANEILGSTLAAILIPAWIISGYVAFVVGLCLVAHFPFRMKHPITVFVLLGVIVYILYWWFFIHHPISFYGG